MAQFDPDEQAELANLRPEEAAKADQAGLRDGAGTIQDPNQRIMTGAVDAADATDEAAVLSGADLTKPVNEKGKNI